MNLFNQYKNKDFIYITNYINSCINDDSLALTPEQLKNDLLTDSKNNTFKEFIDALLNKNPDGLNPMHPNADLLFMSDDKMMPIRENYIPIRTSFAERAWLYYILQDSKTSLFLDEEVRNKLIKSLDKGLSYPISDSYIDIRHFSNQSKAFFNKEVIKCFKKITLAISEHRYVKLTNKSFSGRIYENQTLIPYKFEYSPQFDSFSLSAYPLDTKRPVKMNLSNISNVTVGDNIPNYDKFIKSFEQMLIEMKEKDPIIIEISDEKNGYDRCSYKFSSFDKVCYENENNKLIMNIYYYRFQKDEILRNLLFLGPVVKIISPTSIIKEYINLLKECYKNYEAE